LYFSQERTISRKILEVFVAVLLETAFSKNDILEFYLNEIFLGQEGNVAIHGFGEASLSFFGKDVSELTLAEAALLAGLAKAPSSYSPRNNPERAITRRNVVLQRMYELNKITATELKQAKAITFSLSPARRQRRTAPYFVDYIRANLLDYYDDRYLPNKPLHIYTSIDTQYQLCANKAVSAGLTEIENSRPKLKKHKSSLQAALIAVTPADANIIAWVGGRNYQKNQFDRVSQAKRQPGSSFKPFVHLTALDNLLNQYRTARTTSLLEDEPIVLKIPGSTNWEPQNYDHKFRGEVTLREALVHSLNVPTVNLAIKVGIDSIARTGELFGFGSNLPRVPSLALGAGEVSPLSMARAYNAIANGGMLTDLLPIIAVSNAQDDSIVSKPRANSHRAASEAATFVLTDILRSAIDRGTGQTVRRLGFTNPAAGKTGTTNDSRDSWFVGFTPRLLAVVWVGFDDNSEHGLTGASGAAPIWTKFMKCVEDMEPKIDFVPPPGVVYRDIDISTGLLATSSCPRDLVTREIFVSGYEPITDCTAHSGGFSIFRRSEEPKEEPRDRRKKKEDFLDKIWDSLF